MGDALARLRADRGMTQAALAEQAHMSRVALGRIERGEVHARRQTLLRLAKALQVNVAELVASAEPLSQVRFRSRTRVNGREQILAEVSRWISSYEWLERALGAEARFALRELVGRRLPPGELAVEARALLGLGGKEVVRDLCGLLEDNGVKVLLLNKKDGRFLRSQCRFERWRPGGCHQRLESHLGRALDLHRRA